MAEFRNDGGYPLVISDLAITVDPGEVFEWPRYDPQVNGVVPGCTWLDAPAAEPASERGAEADGAGSASTPPGQPATSTPPAGGTPASGAGQPATSGKTKAADGAAAKED